MIMKKIALSVMVAICLVGQVYAAEELSHTTKTITIVNHFHMPLIFYINRNPEIVPYLPHKKFAIKNDDQITTIVANGTSPDIQEAYISVDSARGQSFGYFGVEKTGGIRGYLGQGIAYSWDRAKYATVTFCTPEEFDKKQHC
jgi:hypothetical protein